MFASFWPHWTARKTKPFVRISPFAPHISVEVLPSWEYRLCSSGDFLDKVLTLGILMALSASNPEPRVKYVGSLTPGFLCVFTQAPLYYLLLPVTLTTVNHTQCSIFHRNHGTRQFHGVGFMSMLFCDHCHPLSLDRSYSKLKQYSIWTTPNFSLLFIPSNPDPLCLCSSISFCPFMKWNQTVLSFWDWLLPVPSVLWSTPQFPFLYVCVCIYKCA